MTQAAFTRGSTMRHVTNMTAASATGLLAMFGVDMVDMYFLTLLGELELAAAVGYAGTLLFFLISVSIGLQIALGAMVARSEGGRRRDVAGRYCASALIFNGLVAVAMSLLTWMNLPRLLALLGASGTTLDYAISYASIVVPSMPILVLGMSAAAGVRAIGDARRAMWATLWGSLVNAALDPLFIFTFGWGLEGAALATVAARTVVMLVAWHALVRVHHLPRRVSPRSFIVDVRVLLTIAVPAVVTNLATPVGAAFVLRTMSQFGDSAVAGAAIMGRITPVAFCAIFALSGAVGPIIGQNAGAGRYDRVRSTIRDAVFFNTCYVLAAWLLLALAAPYIVTLFSASAEAAELIVFYCRWLVPAFIFNGTLFIANASFNNLHHPHWAACFNFGKAVLGVIPLVWLGARWFQAPGVMAGEAIAALAFGVLGLVAVFSLVGRLEREGSRTAAALASAAD